MEQYNCRNILPFLPLASSWKSENAYGFVGGVNENEEYIMAPDSNAIYQTPDQTLEWIHIQKTPPNHVQFLNEKECADANEHVSSGMWPLLQVQPPVSGLKEPYQLERYVHFEESLISLFSKMQHPIGVQKREWNDDRRCALQIYSGSGAAESPLSVGSSRKRTREKAYAADRSRRLRITRAIDALRELVPRNKEVGKEAFVDLVIDHVKHLQNQMKDLCRSRLCGESASGSVIFLEGHGHYIIQEQILTGPLEETIGELFNVYPSAANSLLQSKGLIVMPTHFAEGL